MTARSKIVLIAEDETLVRMMAAELLNDAGFQVIEAANGEEALGFINREGAEISLLFTDISMPGRIDGFQLAHYIRDVWPGIALLITSAGERPLATKMPIGSRFLPKPYIPAQVVTQARALTAK